VSTTNIDALWKRLRQQLTERGMLRTGNPTPAEIARQADVLLGNRSVSRFVNDYYYPRIYGGTSGKLSDAEAEAIVASLSGGHSDEAATSSKSPVAAIMNGKFYETLREAIKDANSGEEILVQPGIHDQPVLIDKTITLVGVGKRGEAILEALNETPLTLASDAIVRNLLVRIAGNVGNEPIPAIDVVRGQPTLEDCDVTANPSGDGIWVQAEANPTVQRCTVYECGRYGIWVAPSANAKFEKCEILKAGAAGVRADSSSHFEDCIISGCEGDGVELSEGLPTFERCELHSNVQCGAYVHGSVAPNFTRCRVHSNQSSGIQVVEGAETTLVSCHISDNGNSGVEVLAASFDLQQCVLQKNGNAGLLLRDGARGLVSNCEVLENASAGIEVRANASSTITES
jgi:hypothetical protein